MNENAFWEFFSPFGHQTREREECSEVQYRVRLYLPFGG